MDRNAKLWTAIVASIVLMWVGASWDIAWHLRLENDTNSPAHYTNLAGRIVLLGALLWAWRDRRVEERGPLVLALAGMGLAILAVPVDQTWHAVFGLDLTTWSPPHLLLFYSTAVSCAGVAWLLLAQKGWRPGIRLASLGLSPGALVLLALLLSRAVSPVLFPAAFNEHLGVAAKNAAAGYTLYHVDPALQDFAAKVEDLPYDDLPHLLYPAYTLAAVLAFVFVVRRMTGMAWLASASIAVYVASRSLADGFLGAIGWPTSAIPYQHLLVALAAEAWWGLQMSAAARAAGGTVAATALAYGYWRFAAPHVETVPLDLGTVPWAFAIALVAGLLAATARPQRTARRLFETRFVTRLWSWVAVKE